MSCASRAEHVFCLAVAEQIDNLMSKASLDRNVNLAWQLQNIEFVEPGSTERENRICIRFCCCKHKHESVCVAGFNESLISDD